MKRNILALLVICIMGLTVVSVAGCDDDKGPAQEAGDKIDNTMNNEGPAEKAGESMDDTADEMSDDMSDAADDTFGDDNGDDGFGDDDE